jgi:hypothetical protein
MLAVVALVAFFSSYDILPLTLSAPFGDLFAHARTNHDYSVTGSVAVAGTTIEGVTFTVRGHTSLRESECSFPKLKLEFPRESGLHSLKIGTHCGETAGTEVTAKYGRLANDQSPHREAAVYRLLETIGLPAFKARPARITYVDTGAGGQAASRLERNAMLIEGTEAAVRRLGGSKEIGETAFTNARDAFTPEDTAALAFAEAMIGNFDWCLRMTPNDTYRCDAQHPLWNVVALVDAGGRARPLMYDFDVAGMVVGHHRWFRDVFATTFAPAATETSIEVLAQLQRARTLFTRAELDATRRRFLQQKANAYRVVQSAVLDAAGRQQMTQYLDSFFAAIASDAEFYRPVVVAADTTAYADAGGAAPACAARPHVPVGTPVSAPLKTDGRLMQVRVLDALWHWAPPVQCPAVRDAVWIDGAAIAANFPTK